MGAAPSLSPSSASPGPGAGKLEEAIRELIRDELKQPASQSTAPPAWENVIWVGMIVANVVLLVTALPDRILKDTSFELASKLIGYAFGGVLLVYSGWAREKLLELSGVRWFQACQIVLFLGLMIGRLPLFALSPELNPPGATLSVDGAPPVELKRGENLRLVLGSHTIRVAPKAGDEKLENGMTAEPAQFTISWKDLLFRSAREKKSISWSPLYPLIIHANNTDSTLEVKGDGLLLPGLAEAQAENTTLTNTGILKIPMSGNQLMTAYLPLGGYKITERLASGKAISPDSCVTMAAEINRVVLKEKSCP